MIKPLNEQGQFVNASFSLFLLLHFDCLFLGRPVLRLSHTRVECTRGEGGISCFDSSIKS